MQYKETAAFEFSNVGVRTLQLWLKLTFVLPALEKTISLKEERDDSILNNLREGAPQGLTGVPKRAAQENDAIPRVAPKWLKHDRHVSFG